VHHHDEKPDSDLTRRDALKLAAGLGAATLIPLVPVEAAQAARKAIAARGAGGPLKFFTPRSTTR
jgi:hypothetical protein